MELKEQLMEAERQLKQSKIELENLNAQLNHARVSLENVQTSLQKLTEQISSERKKQDVIAERLRWQRTLGYVVAVLVIAAK